MKFPPGMIPCACCWSVGNNNHFQERKRHSNVFEWRRFGWDFEMEPWKDSSVAPGEKHQQNLAIRREDIGHVSKLCVKTLFFSGNFHS